MVKKMIEQQDSIFTYKCYYKFVVKFDYILFYMNFNKSQKRPQKLSYMTTNIIKYVIQYKYNECGGSDMENLKSNIDLYMEGSSKYA